MSRHILGATTQVTIFIFLIWIPLQVESPERITVAHLPSDDRENIERVAAPLDQLDIPIYLNSGVLGLFIEVPKRHEARAINALRGVRLATANRWVARLIDDTGELTDHLPVAPAEKR